MKEKIKVIAFVGPTASGKSRLAMSIAEHMNTAIVCMDSMQIYRGMDIGTAKPTEEDRRKVSHYMIDIVDPDQNYTVADYAQDGAKAIKQIASEGKLPVLVGGTGLYLKALMHGFTLGGTKEDPILRAELNLMAQTEEGKLALHDRLHRVDPQSAQRLHPNDIRRVIRAIEVYEQGGIPASQLEPQTGETEFDILPISINIPRAELRIKQEKRVYQMMEQGLLQQVKGLKERGITADMQSMQGLGYKELFPVLQGIMPIEQAVQKIITGTHHYSKRQETWFRHDPDVVWIEPENTLQQAITLITSFLGKDSCT